MRRLVLLLAGLLIYSISFSQNGKRGLAYGYHSPEDMAVLSPEVSWWYNWSVTPESSVAEVYANYNFDFVPMAWNGNFNETELRNFLDDHPNVKYLLGFNEPNFLEQASMTPSEAAAAWPQLEAIADDYDLILVGPAVNYCGSCVSENGTTYTDPFEYLDDFFAACTDCRVDHIAVHSYMNTVAALQWYMGEFKKYGKPIWLTEFAGWESNGNINNPSDQINYMIGAVDYLETDPDIFRYAWFIGRGPGINNYPYIDILGDNGELTEIGSIYKQMPVHDTSAVIAIPARIEAEAYNSMEGILIERTDDVSGFANVGYIEAGDWLEYRIEVPETNTYDIRFRIASTKNAELEVLIDSVSTLNLSISNTNGWQNWANFDEGISLEAGIHSLRIKALTDGFNINWFQIGQGILSIDGSGAPIDEIKLYPNPAIGKFSLSLPHTESANQTQLQVYNSTGQLIYSDYGIDNLYQFEIEEKGILFVRVVSDTNAQSFIVMNQ